MRVPQEVRRERNRNAALLRRLCKQPAVRITGIVSPSGPGGSKLGDRSAWLAIVDLMAWRVDAGPIRGQQLRVLQKVPDDDALHRFMDRYHAYDVITIRARLGDDGAEGDPQALLERVLTRRAGDKELQAEAARLKVPVRRNVLPFGRITFDRRFGWWDVRIKWNNCRTRVSIAGSEAGPNQIALETARAFWRDLEAWDRRLKEFAASEMLELANQWRAQMILDGEISPRASRRLTRGQFIQELQPATVVFGEGGGFSCDFDTSWMFCDHGVEVNGDLRRGPCEAELS